MAILLYQGNNGQKQAEAGPFSTIDNLISRMYQVISSESAESRNWDVFRKLFRSEARINALGKDQRGEERFISLTVEDYIRGAEVSFQKQRLNEQEIGRIVEEYGDMVHIFSAYETKDANNSASHRNSSTCSKKSIALHDSRRWRHVIAGRSCCRC